MHKQNSCHCNSMKVRFTSSKNRLYFSINFSSVYLKEIKYIRRVVQWFIFKKNDVLLHGAAVRLTMPSSMTTLILK